MNTRGMLTCWISKTPVLPLMMTASLLVACDPGDDEAGDDMAAMDMEPEEDSDGEEPPPPDGAQEGFAEVASILAASCSCHESGAGGLSFGGDAYGALVAVPANGADLSYVEPGEPENSYLVHKLRGTQASVGGAGSPMPLGGDLSEAQIVTIEAWIEDGAPE